MFNQNNDQIHRKVTLVILFCIMLSAIVSFVVTPITGDLEVFIAAARQAQYNHPIEFIGIIKTWELKGVGSRIFIWAIYKLTQIFCAYGTQKFPLVFSAIYLVLIMLLLLISFYLLNRKWKRPYILCFGYVITVTGILYSYCCNHMQNEMTGTILLIFAMAVYLGTDRPILKFISGILFGSLFYFKSVLLVMGISFLGAIYLMDKEKKKIDRIKHTVYYLLGAGLIVFGGLLLLWMLYPQEIYDMLDASKFQNTLFKSGITNIKMITIIRELVNGYKDNCLRIPVLFTGLMAALILFIKMVREKNWENIIYLLMLWLSPVIFIVLSNCYFPYHFFTFVFPAIISCIFLIKQAVDENKTGILEKSVVFGTIWAIVIFIFAKTPMGKSMMFQRSFNICMLTLLFMTLAIYIFRRQKQETVIGVFVLAYMLFCSLFFTSFASDYVRYIRKMTNEAEQVQMKNIDKMESDKILYLDGGTGAYCIGAESYLRYFYALPLQRIRQESKEAELECYKDSYSKMMEYQGNYILCDENWFFTNNEYTALKDKIRKEYIKSDEKLVYLSLDWSLFDYRNTCKISDEVLYMRRNSN